MKKTIPPRVIKYAILRNTFFNGVLIENKRLIEVFDDETQATKIARAFQDAVFLPVPLDGFSFNFYVEKV